jgi:2-polyprenyl-3-methyl-5-hydroxy-6-metoxy-1,4-benzoquinol methylase
VATDDEVLHHYRSTDEDGRLRTGASQIEFLRTKEVLLRHLPPSPARILDVGGATGIYSQWLAELGYQVSLIDLSAQHVESAKAALSPLGVAVEQGDARSLSAASASFDAVLLMGPLYHLQDPAHRLEAWRETRRVLRPGGIVAGAAINRFATLLDGLAKGYFFNSDFRRIVHHDLATGMHLNPTRRPEWFTTAYLHRPEELAAEAETAGISVRELVGLEGLSRWLPFDETRWSAPEGRENILEGARLMEHEPTLAGLSAHLLLIGEAE